MLIPFISFFINPENYLFNNFLSSFLGYLNIEGRKEILSFVSITFILIVVLGGFIKLKYIKFSNHLTDNITSDFRIKIFQFLINQDYSYHFKYGTNEIMSNLAQKTGSFTSVIFSAINIFNSSLIMFGIISILIFNEPFYTPIIIFSIMVFNNSFLKIVYTKMILTSFQFTLDFSKTCDDDTLADNAGIDATLCEPMGGEIATVTSIQFLEFDTSGDLVVIKQDDTLFDVSLSDGESFDFASISADLDASASLADQLDLVPGGVQLTLRGVAADGTNVMNRYTWIYTNSCEDIPIESGDEISWVSIVRSFEVLGC